MQLDCSRDLNQIFISNYSANMLKTLGENMFKRLTGISITLLTALIVADATPTSADPGTRPSFQALRFEEDWSAFRPSGDERPFDSVKHVELSDDGNIWASFGGQLRLRGESWSDFAFRNSGARNDTFLLARLRAHADFHFGKHVRAFVEGKSATLTDRNLPGGRRTLDEDTLALQNGFLETSLDVGNKAPLVLRAGRQELLFGKQRLISPLDWANTRRTFDGFTARTKLLGATTTAFFTRPVTIRKRDSNSTNDAQDLFGLYATGFDVGPAMKADAYWIGLAADAAAIGNSAGSERRHTFGVRAFGPVLADGDYDVELAYQTGSLGPDDIEAYMVAAELGTKILRNTSTPTRIFIGANYASGDSRAGDGDANTFRQLFPLGHAYHGFIDIVGRQNVIDLLCGLRTRPMKKLKIGLDVHHFRRAERGDALYHAGGGTVRPGNSAGSKDVGIEVDLVGSYALDAASKLMFGYGHFFADDFIEDSGPSNDIDFVYLGWQYTL